MKNFLITNSFILGSLFCIGQETKKQENPDLLRYRAAEAYYRLNQTGEMKAVLRDVPEKNRGFEWKLLNARADRSLRILQAHQKPVVGLAVSPDGKFLASGSADNSIIIWETEGYRPLRTLTGHQGQVTSLDFSPDSRMLLSGSSDKTLRLWDLAAGTETRNFNHELKQGIYQCRFSHDGKSIAVASWELVTVNDRRSVQGFAKIIDVQTGGLIKRFDTDDHPASSVCFSADDSKLFTGTWGFLLKQHDIKSGHTDWIYDLSNVGYYTAIQTIDISPDNKYILEGGKDNKFRLLDARDGKLIRQVESWEGHTQWVNATRFSPDGNYIATASDDGLIKIWDKEGGKNLFVFRGHTGGINRLVWHPDSRRIFSSSADHTIRVWDLATPGEISFKPFGTGLWYAPLSPDGRLLALAGSEKQFSLWDIHTGKEKLFLDSANNTAAAFSSDGNFVASGNMQLQFFETSTGKRTAIGKGHSGRILGMDYNAENHFFLTAGDITVRLWKPDDSLATAIIPVVSNTSAAKFSPDGQHIYVSGTDGKLRIIHSANRIITDSLQMQSSPINNLAVSPDGRYVASIGETGEAALYQVKKKKTIRLMGHVKAGYAIAFHPSLPILATGSYDQTVRFWNAETGVNTLTLFGYPEAIYTITFSPDGKKLIITEVEGKIHVIDI